MGILGGLMRCRLCRYMLGVNVGGLGICGD